jgi:hypothetical protein
MKSNKISQYIYYFDFVQFHCILLTEDGFESLLQNFSLIQVGSKLGNLGLGNGES